MTQGTFSEAFSRLSSAFNRAFPSRHWGDFARLGVDSDMMLSLAAGANALGKFMFTPGSAPQAQQMQGMGLSQTFGNTDYDPFVGLGNHLPVDALRRLSGHIHAWDPPETKLDAELLRECETTIRARVQSLEGLFEGGSEGQRTVILDLGNVAMLADNLSRLAEHGITARAGFRRAFGNMPILNDLAEWNDFRAESLA